MSSPARSLFQKFLDERQWMKQHLDDIHTKADTDITFRLGWLVGDLVRNCLHPEIEDRSEKVFSNVTELLMFIDEAEKRGLIVDGDLKID